MGAIFGLIGEGSLHEVQAMGEYMPHRGVRQHTWSPAPGVFFGSRGSAEHCGERLTVDAQLDEEQGVDFEALLARGLKPLRGVSGYFSLAYYDAARRNVVLACDSSGFKSLYYAFLPGRVAFASEYKALLALEDFRPRLNPDAAQYYLATRSFRMDQPLMAGVHPVRAGSACRVTPDLSVLIYRYWTPPATPREATAEELARELRTTLERVVARQASRFTRVAVTSSGGLDSACVLALLRHVRADLRIDTFTIGYGPEDPECIGGRELAHTFDTVHHEVAFDPQHLPQGLPGLVWLMEDCAGREEALLQYLVMGEAARAAPVVFGGYGADVLFAGMPRYRLLRLAELMPRLERPLREVFQLTQTGAYPASWLGRLGARVLYRSGVFPPPVVAGASTPARVRDDLALDAYIADQLCEAQDSGYLEASLEAAGAEFRDPFQSTEVMDLAVKIPGRLNVGVLQQKRILRRALADLLPPAIRARRKSLQRVRHDLALSASLDQLADRMLDPDTVARRGLVDPAYVNELRYRAPSEAYSSERLYRLWTLVCLELWQRQFVDAKSRLRESLAPAAAAAPASLQPVAEGIRAA